MPTSVVIIFMINAIKLQRISNQTTNHGTNSRRNRNTLCGIISPIPPKMTRTLSAVFIVVCNSNSIRSFYLNFLNVGIEYLSKNATKCREHLAFKCQKIPEDVRNQMRSTFSQEYISMLNSNKKSSIWEHFSIVEDEGK